MEMAEGVAVQTALLGICAAFAKYFSGKSPDPKKDLLIMTTCNNSISRYSISQTLRRRAEPTENRIRSASFYLKIENGLVDIMTALLLLAPLAAFSLAAMAVNVSAFRPSVIKEEPTGGRKVVFNSGKTGRN